MEADYSDLVAIRLTALDYEEGWFEGNAERIARCLHPHLAKRVIRRDPETGKTYFNHLTKEELIRHTRTGGGTDVPRNKIYYKVDVLDVHDDVAVVRAESFPYIDYLQLVKDEGQWLIVTVLHTANRANC
jgi:hypothetical protein